MADDLGVHERDLLDAEESFCKYVFDVFWVTYCRWSPQNAPLRDMKVTWQLLLALNDLLPHSLSVMSEHEASICGHAAVRLDWNVMKADVLSSFDLLLPHSTNGSFRTPIWADVHDDGRSGKKPKFVADDTMITPEEFLEFDVFDSRRPMRFRTFGPEEWGPRCPPDRSVSKARTFSGVHNEYSRRKHKLMVKSGLITKATHPARFDRHRTENRPRPAVSPVIPMDTNASSASIPPQLLPQNRPELGPSTPSAAPNQ